ncbi:MAG: alanine--tRNA ligase, partial [Nitriliruptoraceae bacterium]
SFQKCVRTNDIENVGRTTRHLSFFEMLGNFSFGDYFKQEAITWAWQLATGAFGLDPDRIWVSIHESDDEAERIWLTETGVPAERLVRMGADNFWDTGGAGPCGPCTELHYDRGERWGEAGGPAVNGERYLEFYNLVFMQFLRDDAGTILGDLPSQNVDTGLGLERLAVLLQDVDNVFMTDLFAPLIDHASDLTGAAYGQDDERDVSLRVIAEHARAAAFLIGDGVLPAKEGRGYVLRRLLRRAMRHAHLLGVDVSGGQRIVVPMVERVIERFASMYPELERQRELITRVADAEERDFATRIRQGLDRLDTAVQATGGDANGPRAFPAATAFELHDTYGFPVDLTAEIVEDAGLTFDRAAFDELMTEQRERARAGARRGRDGIPTEVYREAGVSTGTSEFVGHDTLTAEAVVGAIVTAGGAQESATEGDVVEVILGRTPFYAEGGGQVGDAGVIETPTGRLEVLDTQEALPGLIVHAARVVAGEVHTGQSAEARVDASRRLATARSHSATHVLHATIREELGDHAQQAGSLVQPGRLRFDFPHFEALSRTRIAEIEATINERVLRDPHVHTEVMDLDEARRSGAVANFGDRYGDVVRVVTIGSFSRELCGGTHVPSGASIGTITVVREESVGSNTRRVEALTGTDALAHLARERLVAEEVARLVEAPTDEAVGRVEALIRRLRAAEKQLAALRGASLSQQARELATESAPVDGLTVIARRIDGTTMDELRQLATETRGHLTGRGVVIVGAAGDDGKAQMIAAVTTEVVEAGVEAREVLQPAAELVAGGAGGRGDLAQAGGRDGSRLDEALQLAASRARTVIG